MGSNTVLFSPSELEDLNTQMLGRGAPVEKDDIGYNRPDFVKCRNYGYGLSSAALHDLCQRLKKYRRQLEFSDEDIERLDFSTNHYKQLADNEKFSDFSIELTGGKWVVVHSREFGESLAKKFGTKNIDWMQGEDKSYKIHMSHIFEIIDYLKEKFGYNDSHILRYLNSMGISKDCFDKYLSDRGLTITKEAVDFQFKEAENCMLEGTSDKSLSYFKDCLMKLPYYITASEDKVLIPMIYSKLLYGMLKELNFIILKTNLKEFADLISDEDYHEKPDIVLWGFKCEDSSKVAVSFKYEASVVDVARSVKGIWRGEFKRWVIPRSKISEFLSGVSKLNYVFDTNLSWFAEDTEEDAPKQENVYKIECSLCGDTDFVGLNMDYNEIMISKVKSLPFSKWDSTNRCWTIMKIDIPLFLSRLEDVDLGVRIVHNLPDFIEKSDECNSTGIEDVEQFARKPFKHQIEAAEFLLARKKALLCDEMGVGKTASSIIAAYSVPSPRLVICPASLKLNWREEIRYIDTEGNIQVFSEGRVDRDADWVIVNYNLIESYKDEFKKVKWGVLICDEAHYIKAVNNYGLPDSQRALNVLEIIEHCGIEYVFPLTGTPMTSRPKDLFNLLRAIGHPLGRHWQRFMYYCGPVNNGYGWSFQGASHLDELHEHLSSVMIRRLKKDILNLPPKLRTYNRVEIDDRQFQRELSSYLAKRSKMSTLAEHLVYLNKMRQLVAKKKVPALIEMIENYLENGEPIVVLTNFNDVVDAVMKKFKDRAVKLTGECSMQERQDAVEDFQNGRADVFVGNLKAAGVGLTLTRASNLIINDFWWVPADHIQGEDRIHRIGQINTVNIIYNVAVNAVIDEIMAEIIREKIKIIDAAVDGVYENDEIRDFNMLAEVVKRLNIA